MKNRKNFSFCTFFALQKEGYPQLREHLAGIGQGGLRRLIAPQHSGHHIDSLLFLKQFDAGDGGGPWVFAQLFVNKEVRLRFARDLGLMGNTNDLSAGSELIEQETHLSCRLARNAGIDLVEYKSRQIKRSRYQRFDAKHQSAELSPAGDFS